MLEKKSKKILILLLSSNIARQSISNKINSNVTLSVYVTLHACNSLCSRCVLYMFSFLIQTPYFSIPSKLGIPSMDRRWMKQPRTSDVYDAGANEFLDFAFQNASVEGKISCPCKKCKLLSRVNREDAYDHLIVFGFLEEYTTWVFHRELKSSSTSNNDVQRNDSSNMHIDMDGLLHETFGYHDGSQNDVDDDIHVEAEHQPHDQAEIFYKFVDDANKELYPGCKNFTKLSFIVRLFHIKCLGGWSNNSFTMLLKLLKDVLPEGETLPDSFYDMKKIISKFGLSYEKIHACPNDCILYRGEYQGKDQCPKCHTSRYKVTEGDFSTSSISPVGSSKVPAKVLRYFPLFPRLERLFMCSETASLMRWHKEERTKDGYMRHPADSPAWKTFNFKNPSFALEPRNVRLCLASDGMNPFRTMSTTYSIWPVILMIYNLPPWMCMNADNLILSMVIPGPDSPGNNIDVYLQPLVDELKLLWETGVQTYDISSKMNFNLCASLLWTISDLPALAYLSGWSTRGKYGCICCHGETYSTWLKHGRKFCYMGHRRFLDKKHAFRNDETSFDGGKETGFAPIPLEGYQILEMLEGFEVEFGKTSVNPKLPFNWKKKSIFFELPYWKNNLI